MKEKNISFKSRLKKLEEIYHFIQDSDDSDLDKLIELYEEGIQLARSLEKDIQKYELRIQEITSYDGIHNENENHNKLSDLSNNQKNDVTISNTINGEDGHTLQKEKNTSQRQEKNISLF